MYKNGKFTIARAVDLALGVAKDAKTDPSSGAAIKLRTIKECMNSGWFNKREFNNVMSHMDAAYISLMMIGYLASASERERMLIKPRKKVR